jgi:hypothetical protein
MGQACSDDLPDGVSEIFFREGLDRSATQRGVILAPPTNHPVLRRAIVSRLRSKRMTLSSSENGGRAGGRSIKVILSGHGGAPPHGCKGIPERALLQSGIELIDKEVYNFFGIVPATLFPGSIDGMFAVWSSK